VSFLSQAPRLEGLSPSHSAFQEHAAHIVEWSAMLSSKGSSGTCIPEGVSTFFHAAFTAHIHEAVGMDHRQSFHACLSMISRLIVSHVSPCIPIVTYRVLSRLPAFLAVPTPPTQPHCLGLYSSTGPCSPTRPIRFCV